MKVSHPKPISLFSPMPKINVVKKAVFSGHRDCIYAMTGQNNPNLFFTAGPDGMVVEWDVRQPAQGRLAAKVPGTVYALCHVPEGGFLLVGQNFEGIHVIDLSAGKEVSSLLLGKSAVFDIKYHNGMVLAACGDGAVTVADPFARTVHARLWHSREHARAIAVNPVKNEFAVGYSDNAIRVYSFDGFRLLHTLQGHTNSVFSLAYSPGSDRLLSGSRDAHLRFWDAAGSYAPIGHVVAHMFTINHIAFSPDGRYFATCSKDKSLKLWDAQTQQLLKVVDKARHAGHGTSVNKLLWTGFEGYQLLSCSDDRLVSLWEFEIAEKMAGS